MKSCKWYEQLNVPIWRGECEVLVNRELFNKLGGFAFFRYCPSCGKDIEVVYAK
jgi:hypothetical protein